MTAEYRDFDPDDDFIYYEEPVGDRHALCCSSCKESAARVEELEAALQQIAEPMPTSHHKQIDQLTDAVRWRQGIARDALARAALDKDTA